MKEILEKLIINLDVIDEQGESQPMFDAFNLVMSLCVNLSNLAAYRNLIDQCFKQFDRSSHQDKFHELLFQYTEDCTQVKKMFTETDDYSKYTFFAQNVYLFRIKIETSKPVSQTQAYDIKVWKELVRWITARRVLKRGMKLYY
jgi:hypothetical protein